MFWLNSASRYDYVPKDKLPIKSYLDSESRFPTVANTTGCKYYCIYVLLLHLHIITNCVLWGISYGGIYLKTLFSFSLIFFAYSLSMAPSTRCATSFTVWTDNKTYLTASYIFGHMTHKLQCPHYGILKPTLGPTCFLVIYCFSYSKSRYFCTYIGSGAEAPSSCSERSTAVRVARGGPCHHLRAADTM